MSKLKDNIGHSLRKKDDCKLFIFLHTIQNIPLHQVHVELRYGPKLFFELNENHPPNKMQPLLVRLCFKTPKM